MYYRRDWLQRVLPRLSNECMRPYARVMPHIANLITLATLTIQAASLAHCIIDKTGRARSNSFLNCFRIVARLFLDSPGSPLWVHQAAAAALSLLFEKDHSEDADDAEGADDDGSGEHSTARTHTSAYVSIRQHTSAVTDISASLPRAQHV